jgi:superfamily II DNA/RNA helicase
MHGKKNWEDLEVVPPQIIKNLKGEPLVYSKPSKIQSVSIPKIVK